MSRQQYDELFELIDKILWAALILIISFWGVMVASYWWEVLARM